MRSLKAEPHAPSPSRPPAPFRKHPNAMKPTRPPPSASCLAGEGEVWVRDAEARRIAEFLQIEYLQFEQACLKEYSGQVQAERRMGSCRPPRRGALLSHSPWSRRPALL